MDTKPYSGAANYATFCACALLANDWDLYNAIRSGANPIELLANRKDFRDGLADAATSMADIDMAELRETIEELRA